MKTLREEREEYNNKILGMLSKFLRDNPDQRFGQALVNLELIIVRPVKDGISEVVNPYYIESRETYSHVKSVIERLKL